MAKQLHAIGPVLVPTKVYYFLQGLEIDFKNKSEIEAKVKYYTECDNIGEKYNFEAYQKRSMGDNRKLLLKYIKEGLVVVNF